MKWGSRGILRCAVLLLLVQGLLGVRLCAQAPLAAAAAPTEEQIGQWIAQLSSSRFDDRDRATQALIGAGRVAIPPVLQAIYGADREVALRAVVALQEIGARGDTDTLQAALSGLEMAARRATSPVVAHQAEDALGTLTIVRQERAMEHLQQRGAVVTRDMNDRWYQQKAHFPFQAPVLAIEFGPQWKGTDTDLEWLRWIAEIEQVSFVGPQVKDSWFKFLRNLPKLHSVRVKRAEITNQALTELAQLEGIWCLRLMYVPLDDTSVPLLQNIKGLRELVFISRGLSEKGGQELVQHFGKDHAECPKGALLGVMASTGDAENWRVTTVLEGSAAAKAGILPNDRILKYNGQPITDFFSLKARISQNEPGDTVTLEIERGLETVIKQVTFGEWE